MTVATNPLARLEDAALAAVRSVGGADADGLDASLKPSAKPEFGDFQLNCAMALGKKSGRPPRDVAALLVEELVPATKGPDAVLEIPEIAGPGFINLRLRPEALSAALNWMDRGDLGVEI